MCRFVKFVVCLLVSVAGLVFASATEVDVYLMAGQSNMQGLGKVSELSEGQTEAVNNTYYWNGKSFEKLVVGQTKTSGSIREFGPELGFASVMSPQGRRIYVVKYFASGMPLHHGWDGGKWVGGDAVAGRTNFYPGESAQDQHQGTLYRAMIGRFQTALKALELDGKKPVVRGLLWMQGEQDSKKELSAITYAANLKRLRRRVGEDVGVRELPVVFGQVLPHSPHKPKFTHRDEVRAQMAAADQDSGKPESMGRCKMVPTDSFPLRADTVHYNTKGQWMLGVAMAEALLVLLEK